MMDENWESVRSEPCEFIRRYYGVEVMFSFDFERVLKKLEKIDLTQVRNFRFNGLGEFDAP